MTVNRRAVGGGNSTIRNILKRPVHGSVIPNAQHNPDLSLFISPASVTPSSVKGIKNM